MTSSLPPIDQATLPAEVRNGTKQDKKTYQAALGFERMLLGELTKSLADTAKPAGSDEGDDSSGGGSQDAASSMYLQMLPDQLADAVTAGGGLGLAQSFYQTIKERS
jgi:Rod binding domain-containing protein